MSSSIQTADHDDDLMRHLAAGEVKALEDARALLYSQHADTFKWLTGSLFAVNAAGVIGVLNSRGIDVELRLWAGALFCAGLLIMLLVGIIVQKLCALQIPTVQKQIGYWIGVSKSGERILEAEDEFAKDTRNAQRWAWLSPAIGWLSGTLFIAGAGLLGWGMWLASEVAQ